MEHKVPQAQEIMMDEDMMGTMIDYDLNQYSPAKYPVPCKKRKNPAKTKPAKTKPAKTKSAKTKSAKNEGGSQRKMTDWLISSSRNGRKVTFFEKIEVCEFYKNGTLKKKRIQESGGFDGGKEFTILFETAPSKIMQTT